MAIQRDDQSVSDIARTLLDDVRDLFREEIALARAEVRQELEHARAAGMALGAGLGLLAIGLLLLFFAAGRALAAWFGWPVFGGYALVGVVLLVIGWGATASGRRRLQRIHGLRQTGESLKRSAAWAADRIVSRT